MTSSQNERRRGARNLLFRDVDAHPARFSTVAPLRLQDCPMLVLAVCFAAGILCRPWWQPPADAVLLCILLMFAAAVAWKKAPRAAWPATALVFIALGWTAALLQPLREDTSLLRYADNLQRKTEVEVVTSHMAASAPASAERKSIADDVQDEEALPHAYEVLEVRALRVEDVTPDVSTMQSISGGALVTLSDRREGKALPYLPCGTHLMLTLRMHPPGRYLDPGVWNYADQLAERGISVAATADAGSMQMLPELAVPLSCRFLRAQRWSSERIESIAHNHWMEAMPFVFRFNEADAAMLRAMLFGDRTALDRNVRLAFERTGSFHLFVVAGVHIVLLMTVLYRMLLHLRLPPWLAVLLTLGLVSVYAVLTGFGEPVQRALLMSSVYLVAFAFSRNRQVMNALGTALLVMLLIDHHALTQASLQMTALSVIAVGGIAGPLVARTVGPCAAALHGIEDVSHDIYYQPYLAQMRVTARLMGRLLAGRFRQRRQISLLERAPAWLLRSFFLFAEVALLTLTAETVMALPMAVYFHRMTPFAAPANLLALPLVGFVMGCAMATFLLSLLHPLLALIPAICTALLLHLVSFVIQTLSGLHGADVRMPAPLPVFIVLACVCWLVALVLLREYSPKRGYAGFVLTCVAFVLVLLPSAPKLTHAALEFTAIDVGQGDSLFVATPEGQTVVIDAGGPVGVSEQAAATGTFDVGEEVVSPFLWHRRLRRVDVLVITHAHSDHIGGAMAVLRNFRPRELWVSVDADSMLLRNLVDEARRLGVVVRHLRAGDRMQMGSVRISVVSPSPEYKAGAVPVNDDSLVFRMDFGRASVLAEGDAEQRSEEQMIQQGLQPVTLLKVGHHGSNTSTTEPFLEQLHPQCAVISCGRGNHFGHPRMPVLQRLQAMDVKTSRTDTMGAVSYLLRADGTVTTSVLMSEP